MKSPFDRFLPAATKARSRKGSRKAADLRSETLEQRLALAVEVFAQPSYTPIGSDSAVPGWVTVIGDASDDIYMQQVATAPQSLIVADNGSFLEPRSVRDIDARFATIYVTNGQSRSDSGLLADNSPLYSTTGGNRTRFALQSAPIASDLVGQANDDPQFLVTGTLRYTQDDGSVTIWTFSNFDPVREAYGASLRLTSGPGASGATVPNGTVYPTAVSIFSPHAFFDGFLVRRSAGPASLDVVWSASPNSSIEVESISYYGRQAIAGTGGFFASGATVLAETSLKPSAAPVSTFTLRNTNNSQGIVPGTLSGVITDKNNVLVPFHSAEVFFGAVDPAFWMTTDIPLVFGSRQWSGTYHPGNGTISLSYSGQEYRNAFGAFYLAADPGNITMSASYAVYNAASSLANQPPGSLTVFAGHDISRQFVADLLAPGATINVDSPLRTGSYIKETTTVTTVSGGGMGGGGLGGVGIGGGTTTQVVKTDVLATAPIQLRASNVNINAEVRANGSLILGRPIDAIASETIVGDPLQSLISRTAVAFAATNVQGQVTSITIPPGQGGSGYDQANPPTVTIDDPVSVNAQAAITGIVGGVEAITVVAGGTNYPATGVTVDISPPDIVGGVQATATPIIRNGAITGFTITERGSGYLAAPTVAITAPQVVAPAIPASGAQATAVVSGRIAGLQLVSGGFGYVPNSTVNVVIGGSGNGARASVRVDENGALADLALLDGGDKYRTDNTTIAFSPPVVNPPPQGIRARAEALVGNDGTITAIRILDNGKGYGQKPAVRIAPPPPKPLIPTTPLENLVVNAQVAAPVFDIRVKSDPRTAPTQTGPDGSPLEKGSIIVSPTGSLVANVGSTTASSSIFLQAYQSDVRIEGLVSAGSQSYLMQSTAVAQQYAPYVLTTRSRSGAATGRIRGGTVAVTLGNDALTPRDEAVAVNVCDIDTDIGSFRIRAAAADGGDRRDAFPYVLNVREANDITFEAVASSSFPIDLRAEGSTAFTAAIATAGDFIVNTTNDLTLQSIVSTSRGRIIVNGASVTVQNGLTVGDAAKTPLNAGRQDIVLNSQGGGLAIAGVVSAPNSVSLVQRNAKFSGTRRKSAAPNRTLLPGSTVTEAINVPDNFVFKDLNVELNITHELANLLSVALIAPDGTRVNLASFVGGRTGGNFTNTIFDSEAATSINNAAAPFTGSFRPQQPLSALYNRSAFGTWRLQVTNTRGFTDTGTSPVQGVLNNFTLAFTADTNGVISGPGRIVADALSIDAETAIGDAGQLPGDVSYFLRTNVNTLTARAGGSIAIDEADTIDVQQLRAGGIVAIRANGFDTDSAPALRAVFTDVKAMDVSAPNGSIDVSYNSPAIDVALGNAKNLSLNAAARAGKVFSMLAGGSVSIRSSGGSALSEDLVVLDAPLAGSGARVVRAVITNAIGGTYEPETPGVRASTIKPDSNGLPAALPGISSLRFGDRILVAGGTRTAPGVVSNANGVYIVAPDPNDPSNSKWRLVRAADSDTAAEMPTNTFVKVQDGTASAKFFQVKYNTPTAFANTPITVTDVTALLKTNIGSDDPSDIVQFVVSTPDGTNAAPGSLGKMIDLRQMLDTSASPTNPNQSSEFYFSTGLGGPIRLTQQLPVIVRNISIDGSKRLTPAGTTATSGGKVVVDGSQISLTAGNTPVQSGDAINGFEFRGAGAAGSVLANLTASGFTKGAAAMVDGVPGMTIANATFGLSDTNDRLQNDHGIVVKGNSSNVQINGVTVASSRLAGIAVLDSATGTTIVGSMIGVSQRDNGTGVVFDSTGANRLGSASGARNFVRFNQTGVVLKQGTNIVVNTDISNNTFDGVRIEGGTNAVGTAPASAAATATTTTTLRNGKVVTRTVRAPKTPPAAKGTLSATSNAIYVNGRWGVNIISAAVARLQRVAGNYLGSGLFNSTPGRNASGNVGVGGSKEAAESLGYKANAKTGLDANGNQHTVSTRGPAKARVAVPWRPRR
jgi:subtilisin-like proprotein convertase family protein